MVAVRIWFSDVSHVLGMMCGWGDADSNPGEFVESLVLPVGVGRTYPSDRTYMQQWLWEKPQRKEDMFYVPSLPLAPIWEICLGIILEVWFLEISWCLQRRRRPSRCSDWGAGISLCEWEVVWFPRKIIHQTMRLGLIVLLFTRFCVCQFTYESLKKNPK